MSYFVVFPSRLNSRFVDSLPSGIPGDYSADDVVMEAAARACYRSTASIFKAPKFLHKLNGWGHVDVFEHGAVTLMLRSSEPEGEVREFLDLVGKHRYFHCYTKGDGLYLIVSSVRVWKSIFDKIPPIIARSIARCSRILPGHESPTEIRCFDVEPVETKSGARVTLCSLSNIGGTATGNSIVEQAPGSVRATFYLDGISRAMSHQIVRHRLFVFSQESQRYVNVFDDDYPLHAYMETEELISTANEAFVIPDFGNEPASKAQTISFCRALARLVSTGKYISSLGARKEDARFLAPNATRTRLYMSGNLEAWGHFIRQRTDKAAQWEIRECAWLILEMLSDALRCTKGAICNAEVSQVTGFKQVDFLKEYYIV
ncbi:MAG: hypothetical protein KatS3mg087_1823 [Patescibacteria group bacterium]|nr:MAG: hypothetical protein KatS3mg087_1823 [Patescibacteria group bacterium]